MEKLLAAAAGGQKPSDMLHDLVQFCPDGEAQTRIFRYLFLQRLPTEIRIILAEDRDSTLAALAARADHLWAHSTRQPHNAAVNAVLEEEGHKTIAAVSHSHHSRGGRRGRGRGGQSRPFRGAGAGRHHQEVRQSLGIHMVQKPDGSWRPCGDNRRLNLDTIPDSYPLPNMMDFAAKMSRCRIFSTVDLRKGYHQIPITPFGLYEFLRMGFGFATPATHSSG
jgi:hypothetical protein